ncbi:MAG TPA: PEP-CTERM sorting domain-containing protein [Nitrospira sp.]|nr:PEP-CTERM sorting domain-containing protein [Nitrospira sp.]
MKVLIYGSLFALLTFLNLPTAADAFSRRSNHSEVTQSQTVTAPLKSATIGSNDVSAMAVPEPPVLMLMSIGIGLFALGLAIKFLRKQS